jgi:hypothetical protein
MSGIFSLLPFISISIIYEDKNLEHTPGHTTIGFTE